MMDETKVGIIGAGGIAGGKHLPGHRNVEGVSIIAVCDIDRQRAENFAKQHDIKHVFTDYNDLVAMPELDAVSVCTPNNFHAPPTIAALEAGKHVICEKPIAGNANDGQAMVDAQKASGKVLQIGLQSRFGTEARTLRKLYEDGFFGDIYYARAMAMRRRGVPASPSFITKSIAGGGPLIDIGVHILDVLLWMIGTPKPIEAFGSIAQKFGHQADVINPWGKWTPAQFDVEDFAMGVIRFEGGLTVTLETAWASHIENTGTTFFMGDRAGATYGPARIYTDKEGEMIDYEPELLTGLPGEFESFHKAIREGLSSPVPPEEVLLIAKIFDALYESARIGRSVPIK
jgi:predicted dehydrogenase